MAVRRSNESDLQEVLSVINESNRSSYKAIIPAEHFKEPVLTMEELGGLTERMTFYIHEGVGRVVGVAALEDRGGGAGQVHWMYVLPGWQGRGVGTALVGRIESNAVEAGINRLLVVTAKGAHWARAFYEGLGYELVRTRDTPEGGVATFEKVLGRG